MGSHLGGDPNLAIAAPAREEKREQSSDEVVAVSESTGSTVLSIVVAPVGGPVSRCDDADATMGAVATVSDDPAHLPAHSSSAYASCDYASTRERRIAKTPVKERLIAPTRRTKVKQIKQGRKKQQHNNKS